MVFKGWSEELASIAEDVAQTCSNDPTSQSRLSAALGSQFSWVGENRHLVNLTDKGDALVSAFSCWYEGEGCSSDRKEQVGCHTELPTNQYICSNQMRL